MLAEAHEANLPVRANLPVTHMLPVPIAGRTPALLDLLQSIAISLRLLIRERILDTSSVTAQVNGIENGERAPDAPHEADTKANQGRRTEGNHRANLISVSS